MPIPLIEYERAINEAVISQPKRVIRREFPDLFWEQKRKQKTLKSISSVEGILQQPPILILEIPPKKSKCFEKTKFILFTHSTRSSHT